MLQGFPLATKIITYVYTLLFIRVLSFIDIELFLYIENE